MKTIDSDSCINIDNHFKVNAGPGAGKTYWLINHVKNVIQNSERLGKTGKIACITYTNTAVEEIQERLRGISDNKVFIGTIHSFLYTNVVKPYAFLIKNEKGENLLNLEKLDGHDDHIPYRSLLSDWINNTIGRKNYYLIKPQKFKEFTKCLTKYDWMKNESNDLEIKLRTEDRWMLAKYRIPGFSHQEMLEYKILYWNRGLLHHEDVLYFSYRILTEHPKVVSFLSAKFPYLFIDEFQDTNPIQTEIVHMLSSSNSLVGVIGDSSQSIYRFQGAERKDFENFALPNMKNYAIRNNRRSTDKIINFLNDFNGDSVKQKGIRKVQGRKVILLIGDMLKAAEYFQNIDTNIAILARNNKTIGEIKRSTDKDLSNLWDDLRAVDSNSQRQLFLYLSIYSVELLEQKNFADALRNISKLIKTNTGSVDFSRNQKRIYAIRLLEYLHKHWNSLQKKSLLEYNNETLKYIQDNFNIHKPTSKITKKGENLYNFASSISISDCAKALKLLDEKSIIKTIHKAKGAEYDSVLVIMEQNDIKNLYEPKINSAKDDTRVYYVGFSRAMNHLYINVPELDETSNRLIQQCDKVYL